MTTDTDFTDIIIVSENSGRSLVGKLPDPIINENGVVVLKCPLMFAEQKSQDPQTGKLHVQPMMMPLLFSEYVDEIIILPASWIILPANGTIAMQYRTQWNEYETAVRAQSAGIVMSRTIPKGPVLVPPNGRT